MLLPSSGWKMEAVCSSESLVSPTSPQTHVARIFLRTDGKKHSLLWIIKTYGYFPYTVCRSAYGVHIKFNEPSFSYSSPSNQKLSRSTDFRSSCSRFIFYRISCFLKIYLPHKISEAHSKLRSVSFCLRSSQVAMLVLLMVGNWKENDVVASIISFNYFIFHNNTFCELCDLMLISSFIKFQQFFQKILGEIDLMIPQAHLSIHNTNSRLG